MKNVQKVSPPRDTSICIIGWSKRLAMLLAAFVLLMGTAMVAQAKDRVTQLQYLQWLVKVSGDTAQFNNSSKPQDYVQWALAKGMQPNGGWKPTQTLKEDQLAQTLVQLLQLNPNKKNADYEKILKREGIVLQREENDDDNDKVTQKGLASLFDDIMFKNRHDHDHDHDHDHKNPSPHKPPKPPHHGDDDGQKGDNKGGKGDDKH
jgi:hypothetical protein